MPRKPKPPKYRRCQECGHVAVASAFARALKQRTSPTGAELRVACPVCGYVALYWAFPLAEPPGGERSSS
jgi:DNA-directed RNA polymerase subunit RPC12/RpoP